MGSGFQKAVGSREERTVRWHVDRIKACVFPVTLTFLSKAENLMSSVLACCTHPSSCAFVTYFLFEVVMGIGEEGRAVKRKKKRLKRAHNKI